MLRKKSGGQGGGLARPGAAKFWAHASYKQMLVSRVRESDLELEAPLSQIMAFRSFIRH